MQINDGMSVETSEKQLLDDAIFKASTLRASINGYMYCNLPTEKDKLSFVAGERIRFHLMALGAMEDVHTPVFSKFHHSQRASIA